MSQSVDQNRTDVLQAWTLEKEAPGKYLKQLRELHKKSIKEIATELGVGVDQVTALENDDKAALPAPIYVKSYIRRYCLCLGVSESDISELLESAEKQVTPVLSRVSLQQNTNVRHVFMRVLGYFVIVLVILLLLYGARSLDIGGLWKSVSSSSSVSSSESTATELSLPVAIDDDVR